jgi:hypothetical protein
MTLCLFHYPFCHCISLAFISITRCTNLQLRLHLSLLQAFSVVCFNDCDFIGSSVDNVFAPRYHLRSDYDAIRTLLTSGRPKTLCFRPHNLVARCPATVQLHPGSVSHLAPVSCRKGHHQLADLNHDIWL